MFGLNVSIGLISDNHREHLHDMAIKNYDVVVKENLLKKGVNTRYVVGSRGRTREQLSEQSLRMLKKGGLIKNRIMAWLSVNKDKTELITLEKPVRGWWQPVGLLRGSVHRVRTRKCIN